MILQLVQFFLFLVTYSIVSMIALFYSSSGWTPFLMLAFSAFFYGSVLCFAAITSIILYTQGTRKVVVSKKILMFVIVLQVLTLLFNCGDCGDAPGNSIFLFRLLFPNHHCRGTNLEPYKIFCSGLLMLYSLSYLIGLGIIYWKSRVQKKTSTILLVTIYTLISIVAIVIFSLFLGFPPPRFLDSILFSIGIL